MRTRAITDEELDKLCKNLNTRDSLIFRIARFTGLRISDILALKAKKIAPRMEVCEQKTGKTRNVEIPQDLYRDLKKYCRSERRRVNDNVFPVSRQTVWNNASKAAKNLGMKRISAHSCRKAYAIAYAKTNGVYKTQAELQHDNIATTLLYLTPIELYNDEKEVKK